MSNYQLLYVFHFPGVDLTPLDLVPTACRGLTRQYLGLSRHEGVRIYRYHLITKLMRRFVGEVMDIELSNHAYGDVELSSTTQSPNNEQRESDNSPKTGNKALITEYLNCVRS